jgi:hypothetical protein
VIAVMLVVIASFAPVCMPPPVAAPVAVPFRAPSCPFCAGHRGVGFEVRPGTSVQAVADGTVTFAGGVAGVRYVVVQHLDGRRATYGLLREVAVRAGRQVRAGEMVGRSTAMLYFGLRDADDEYIDPTPLLGRWLVRPRLVPVDGTAARRAPPARLVCRSLG